MSSPLAKWKCLFMPHWTIGGKSPEWGLGGRGKTFYVRIISNNHLWILSAEQTQQCLHKSKSLLSCSSSSSTLLSAFTSFVLLCDTVSCSAFIRFSSFFIFAGASLARITPHTSGGLYKIYITFAQLKEQNGTRHNSLFDSSAQRHLASVKH